MRYFTIKPKDEKYFVFFQNNQIYYSGQKPNYFKDNNIEPLVFFEKANKLLNKYGIKVPNNYLKRCFIDRFSSYFNNPRYADKFDGKGHIILCTFGSDDYEHGYFITKPMKLTIQVLRGKYIGDICVSSCYQKGKILEKKEILIQAYELGKKAIKLIEKHKYSK